MKRKLYLECYTGVSCRKLVGVLLALGVDKERLEKRLSVLIRCPVHIEAQYADRGIPEVLIESIETEEFAFQSEKEARESFAAFSCGERTRNALYRLWKYSEEMREAETHKYKDGEAFFESAAALLAVEMLGFEKLQLLSVTETMDSREGRILPGTELLHNIEKYRIPMHFVRGEKEKSSLLGMKILGLLGEPAVFPDKACVEKAALGSVAGQEDPQKREGLRAVVLTEAVPEKTEKRLQKNGEMQLEKQDRVRVLETNVDDCSGEQLGYAIDCLMRAGALDASCFPIYMKKGRPAYMLQVICREEKQEMLEDIIFRETTSIGLRRYEEKRRILPRAFEEAVLKDGHKVRIKVCYHHGQKFCYPEYENVKQVCEETGRPFREVYEEASAAAGEYYEDV